MGGIISIAGAFAIAFVATGMAIVHRTGCLKEMSVNSIRSNAFSIAHVTEKTNRAHSDHEISGDYDYTSSLESSSLVDHKNHSTDEERRKSEEEEIDFQYPKRIRKGAYIEPQGLFEAPFKEKYAEIPKRDEV